MKRIPKIGLFAKFLSSSTLLVLISSSLSSNTAFAFDASDNKAPTATIVQISDSSIPDGFIAFQVKVTDEKNVVQIRESTYSANPSIIFQNSSRSSGIAPVCAQTTQGGNSSALLRYRSEFLVIDQGSMKITKLDRNVFSETKEASFLLITDVPPAPKLASGCPEWRDDSLWRASFSLEAVDKAGNVSRVSSLPVPVKLGTTTLCSPIALDKFSENYFSRFKRERTAWDEFKAQFPANAQEIESAWISAFKESTLFFEAFPKFLDFWSSPFSLRSLSMLPKCPDRPAVFAVGLDSYLRDGESELRKYRSNFMDRVAMEAAAKAEAKARAENESRNKQDLEFRLAAEKAGTLLITPGCHARGLRAEVQIKVANGAWSKLVDAKGWVENEPGACPSSHPVKPWAVVDAPNGSLLRWRWVSESWDLQSEPFVWENKLKLAPNVTEKSNALKKTITCTKGKLTKKITAVNPKCPKGYKKK